MQPQMAADRLSPDVEMPPPAPRRCPRHWPHQTPNGLSLPARRFGCGRGDRTCQSRRRCYTPPPLRHTGVILLAVSFVFHQRVKRRWQWPRSRRSLHQNAGFMSPVHKCRVLYSKFRRAPSRCNNPLGYDSLTASLRNGFNAFACSSRTPIFISPLV